MTKGEQLILFGGAAGIWVFGPESAHAWLNWVHHLVIFICGAGWFMALHAWLEERKAKHDAKRVARG